MSYRLDPARPVQKEIRRTAKECIDDAVDRLDGLADSSPTEIEEAVHEVRKRCKEARGLARLVRPELGDSFGRFNQLVRDAAEELSSIRDAHAVLATVDELRGVVGPEENEQLGRIRSAQAQRARLATRTIRGGDPRIRRARSLLKQARKEIKHWSMANDFSSLAGGLEANYRRGRIDLRQAERKPTDERLHEWRKAVKILWYQTRLLEATAPSMVGPLVARLDQLADALGDDHDLAVLVERLQTDELERANAKQAIKLARKQQDELRAAAFRLAATLYAEKPGAFVDRMSAYWTEARKRGSEQPVGGIGDVAAPPEAAPPDGSDEHLERERKFIVSDIPAGADAGRLLRQGYLIIDPPLAARIRDDAEKGCTLTIKVGSGAVRQELEWPIGRDTFDGLWNATKGRQIEKTRRRLDLDDGHTAEIDVFHQQLDGLILAEVEFESMAALDHFEPPSWFGAEVTDDERYTNAALSSRGVEPSECA